MDSLTNYLFNDVIWPNIPLYTKWYQYQAINYDISYYLNDLIYLSNNNFKTNTSATHQLPSTNDYIFSDTLVTAFPLCHEVPSSAFLFEKDNIQIIYFSDTGLNTAKPCDWRAKVSSIWSNLNIEKLRGILIETSFSNDTPDSNLFGHLRPKDLIQILAELKSLKGGTSLQQLNVVITHIKPTFTTVFTDSNRAVITRQIQDGAQQANLDCNFIFPKQGEFMCFE